jgi:acetoin utilization deacetylase AcuC-like enzyme
MISNLAQLVQPLPASDELLLTVHSSQYLLQLHSSSLKAAQVTELAPLAMLPHSLVKKKVMPSL